MEEIYNKYRKYYGVGQYIEAISETNQNFQILR